MHTILKISRIFFALGIIGLAGQQFMYADFRPVILPAFVWLSGTALAICAYIFSAGLIVTTLAIIAERQARLLCLLFGGIMLALFILALAPYQFYTNQLSVGAWTSPLKGLAISGCFFVVAGSFPPKYQPEGANAVVRLLEKLIPVGPVFYSITMIVFGIAHFIYTDFVATLVPDWIPGHVFWTYFAGVALIAAGVAIIFNIQARLAANLLGISIFIWFIVLHIPRGIADPVSGEGNELASVFESLAFSGICFIMGARLPGGRMTDKNKQATYKMPAYSN